ncbi:MAG: CopG family transcriptional regulator [Candidatus Saccharimonadales bacterium]
MRTTINFDDKVLRALKLQAAQSEESVSEFVQRAVIDQLLEDMEDIEDAMARIGETTISHDELMGQLHKEGLL